MDESPKRRPEDLIRETCSLLFAPGQTIEVRGLKRRGTASGYFTDPTLLARTVAMIEDDSDYLGLYVTLNPVNPALLSRRANRIETRLGDKEPTTADKDILRRYWLPIDIDPSRPSGISSSDEEHQTALTRAKKIATSLSKLDWPEPIYADSGNGAHLLYRIDLPNDDESHALVKACLENLSLLFSDTTCQVDTANHNAARIWKLYGTISRKGDNTPDRPHRRAALLSAPKTLRITPIELLNRLAGLFPKEESIETPVKRTGTINLAEWLDSHHLGYTQKPYADGHIFILDQCPFSTEHTDGAYAIQFASGGIFAGCHHTSCGGGRQRWPDLKKKYEGDSRSVKASPVERARCSIPDDIRAEAEDILKYGDPLRYMLDTFARDHEGDQVVAECLILSLASRSILNSKSKGLHVSVTGESGKGKTHSFETMMEQVPRQFRVGDRLSDKALYYAENLRPGMVIALDDTAMSDQMQEILKGVTSSFQKPFVYQTVNKDRKAQTCTIPERCVWWVAKVDGTGDDQVWNRMLTVWIDDSEEQDRRVLTRSLADAAEFPTGTAGTRRDLLVCQALWERLFSLVWVVIPFSPDIRFQSVANRRNPDMLLDLVRANAILMQFQRERVMRETVPCITATMDDFQRASRLYALLNGKAGSQAAKLTRREADLIAIIRGLDQREFTVPFLQRATGWANSTLRRMIHGYTSRGVTYAGLLEKCPAISYTDRTVTSAAENVQRRAMAYLWDDRLYEAWSAGCGCWIERSAQDGDDFHDSDGDDGTDGATVQQNQQMFSRCWSSQSEGNELDLENTQDNKNNNIRYSNGGSVCTANSTSDSTSAPVCSSAEHQRMKPTDIPLIQNLGAEVRDLNDQQMLDTAEHLKISDPDDFIRIEGLDHRACSLCGKRPVRYQERFTPKRAKERTRGNYVLCKDCFEEALRKKAGSFRTLPGVVKTAGMVPVQASVGRCQVCHTREAVWSRPGIDNLALCDLCYYRETHQASGVI